MRQISVFVIIIMCVVLVVITGCAKVEQYGKPLSSGPITKISDIRRDPAAYMGKTVKVEGKIVNECPTGCWFNVTDEMGTTLYIDLLGANLAIPQKVGKHVVLEGTIKEKSGTPLIHGTGVVIK
jgi:RecJ-like exonuclease